MSAGKMYWTDYGMRKIQRANLDGTEIEDLVTRGPGGPEGIALDVSAGKMYWTDWQGIRVQRSNLDGSGIEDLVTSGLWRPEGIVLDIPTGKMYWTDVATGKIHRANLDGSEAEDLVASGLKGPDGITIGPDTLSINPTPTHANTSQDAPPFSDSGPTCNWTRDSGGIIIWAVTGSVTANREVNLLEPLVFTAYVGGSEIGADSGPSEFRKGETWDYMIEGTSSGNAGDCYVEGSFMELR